MFKSLLRTLPTLSGNIVLSCNIDTVYKTDVYNEYEVYINNAMCVPQENSLYTNIYNVGLLNSSWEFDVKNFYKMYADNFYSDLFMFDKNDFQKINFYDNCKEQHCTDFEFGCKRQLHAKTGYQFIFYAPIYCDDIDSLPDSFELHIDIPNKISKKITIHIGDDTNEKYNYLYRYLKRYINKIDDNVMNLLPETKQCIIHGIDVNHGGFVSKYDNIIGSIFNNQGTINNFDNTLCKAFERNNVIVSQVIPLAFSFNISSFFTTIEKSNLNLLDNFKITGYYIRDGHKLDFYDYEIDYTDYYPKISEYNEEDNKMYNICSAVNAMNVKYPSLNEGRYSKYEYTNKLHPTYSRWKMKYSTDEHPYIPNLSFAFSYSQESNKEYGEFPLTFYNNKATCDINANNLVCDWSSNNEEWISNINNYCSNWFEVINSEDIEDLTTNSSLWAKIDNNKAYYKGILYDFNALSYYDSTIDFSADKFAVFVKPELECINNKEYSYKYKTVSTVFTANENGGNANIDTSINTNGGGNSALLLSQLEGNYATISNDLLLSYNETGEGKYIEIIDYYSYNSFVKASDINIDLTNIDNSQIYKNAFELIHIGSNNNIYNCIGNIDTNKLYFSPSTSTAKYSYTEMYGQYIKDGEFYSAFSKDTFISTYEAYLYGIDTTSYDKYYYVPISRRDIVNKNNEEETIYNAEYFDKILDDNVIYVDPINIDSNIRFNSKNVSKYAKIYNLEHLKQLGKEYSSLLHNIYVRKTYISKDLKITNRYIKLNEYISNIENYSNYYLYNHVWYNEAAELFTFNYNNFTESVELYFYKSFLVMNDIIYNLIHTERENKDYVFPLLMYKENRNFYTDINEFEFSNNYYNENYPIELITTSIYRFDKNVLEETLLLLESKRIEYSEKDNYYIYKNQDVDAMIDYNIAPRKIKLGSYKTYDIYDSDLTELSTNSESIANSLNIYDNGEEKFAYYIIKEKITNSVSSFNTRNNNYTNSFSYINGISIIDNQDYFVNNFKKIVPFLNDYIFKDFEKLVREGNYSTIVYPDNYKISLNYRQYLIDKGNSKYTKQYNRAFASKYGKDGYDSDYIYTIEYEPKTNKKVSSKLSLNRYLNNVVPLITKSNNKINNYWRLKLKTIDANIPDANIESIPVTIYKAPELNITYKYNKLLPVETYLYDDKQYYEYKYYNDSHVYNLPVSISYTKKGLFIKDKLDEYVTNDKLFEAFTSYINNKITTKLDNNILLFLYNKYKANYKTVFKKNAANNIKLYELIYEFTLL